MIFYSVCSGSKFPGMQSHKTRAQWSTVVIFDHFCQEIILNWNHSVPELSGPNLRPKINYDLSFCQQEALRDAIFAVHLHKCNFRDVTSKFNVPT